MLRNTHTLRLQIDNPRGFILHCMSELSDEGVRRTIQLNKDKAGIQEALDRLGVTVPDFVQIVGTKGTFLVRGYYDTLSQAFYTLDGHAYAFELLLSENKKPMRENAYTQDQLIGTAVLAMLNPTLYVKKRMQVPDDRWKNEEAETGIIFGSLAQTYYTFIAANDKGIKLHLCETEINPHNSENPIHVIVPANAEEIREYGINVQRFAEELKMSPEKRTMRIL
mgnify:CR=1 FL=1